jgi:dTDP-4-amino-4,6-dideoxygalactose transaminase
VATQYIAAFENNANITLPPASSLGENSWQMFPIKVDPTIRESVLAHLNKNQVGASVHFDPPVHWQDIAHTDITLPVTEKLATSTITLPISSVQTQAETDYVIQTLNNALLSCTLTTQEGSHET